MTEGASETTAATNRVPINSLNRQRHSVFGIEYDDDGEKTYSLYHRILYIRSTAVHMHMRKKKIGKNRTHRYPVDDLTLINGFSINVTAVYILFPACRLLSNFVKSSFPENFYSLASAIPGLTFMECEPINDLVDYS